MRTLTALAALQAVLYAILAWLSFGFSYGSAGSSRPLLLVLSLFTVAFVLYLVSLAVALKAPASWKLAGAVVAWSLLYRVLLLPTPPIQEIDIYRYLWDGAVTAHGLNPYRFAPAQVTDAPDHLLASRAIAPYARVRDDSLALAGILARIHYAELTTIYPPISQLVFAAGHWMTPPAASIEHRVVLLKAVLLGFDLATIAVLSGLLKTLSWHPGWVVAYAWCPLVMKEFANTGHLDSIAVFFCMAALLAVVRAAHPPPPQPRYRWVVAASVLLSLGVGAKLYPAALLPLFVAILAARSGRKAACVFAAACAVAAAGCLLPMFATRPAETALDEAAPHPAPAVPHTTPDDEPTVALLPPQSEQPTAAGLPTFLARWEMNDLLFMLVLENLRPDSARGNAAAAWFVVTSDAARQALVAPVADRLGQNLRATSFLITRGLTTIVLGLIVAVLAWRVYRSGNLETFLEACFLTLAWLWLLAPTQNPWYWTWAVPLLPFARGRAWYLLSGLAVAYYLRFWLQYHFPAPQILGTPYGAAEFFDFIVVPLEFGPWLLLLAAAAVLRRWRSRRTSNSKK